MKYLLKAGVAGIAAAALFAASPASAALTVVVGGECSLTASTPDALKCAGAYAGNLNSNASIADLNAALDELIGGSGYDPDAIWADLDPTKAIFSAGAGTIVNFSETLTGLNIISAHFGDAGTGLGDRTILYLFDFGAGATSVDLGVAGFSNAVQIAPPIPEPGTWGMMLLGFGAMGLMIRRTRRRREPLPQLA